MSESIGARGEVGEMDALSVLLLTLGGTVIFVALVMILGFAISMPIGVVYAAKDHHDHQPPHVKHAHRYHLPRLGH